MDQNLSLLSCLPVGKKARVDKLLSKGHERRRMLDLGLICGTPVEAVQKSPSGDPTAYSIRGAVIALRTEEADKISIKFQ